ncbi:hypothetical protein BSLG_008977 [Batrachochytrium salamandrivorans]|nr:hypothetical protein BSLG_008977 [Batrachochytrium salamandrivorans]
MRLSILAVLINASLVLGQQYYVNTGPNSLDVNSPTYQKHKRAAGPSFATTHSHELASPTVNLSASQSPSTTTVVPPKQNSSSYPKWNKIAVDRAAGRFTFVPFTRAQKETVLKNVETIFKFVDGPGNIVTDPTVVVSKLSNNKEFRELVGSAYDAISIGDKLESIDGLSFYNWYTKNRALLSGANEFGGQRSALRYLTLIQGKINRLPDTDSLQLRFKSQNGKSYDVHQICPLQRSRRWMSLLQQRHNSTLPAAQIPAPWHKANKRIKKKDLLTGENSDQPFKFKDGDVTSLSWAIWKPKSKNLGIIQIKDFQPGFRNSHLDATQAMVQEIRTLLVTELKYTKAVILDIRALFRFLMQLNRGI